MKDKFTVEKHSNTFFFLDFNFRDVFYGYKRKEKGNYFIVNHDKLIIEIYNQC